jgi:hypothetical protein
MSGRIATVEVARDAEGRVTARVRNVDRDAVSGRELHRLIRDQALEAVAAALSDDLLEETERVELATSLRELAARVERGELATADNGDRTEARSKGLVALARLRALNERDGVAEPTPEEAIEEVRTLRGRR